MLLRPEASRGPKPAPIVVSLITHATLLALVAFGPAPAAKRKSLYESEISPHEKKLVWYRFNKKLPDVSPIERPAPSKRTRAEVKHPDQTIVSRTPKTQPVKQTILTPGPELKIQVELQAPNLMAFEVPKPPDPAPQPKLFIPPPPIARATEQPALESVPALAATPPELPTMPTPRAPKPEPKKFVPPTQVARRTEAPTLQPGEERFEPAPLNRLPMAQIAGPPRPKPKAFTPQPKSARRPAALPLPALPSSGPQISSPTLVAGIPSKITVPPRPKPKAFTPPPIKQVESADRAPLLPTAPAPGIQAARSGGDAKVPVEIAMPARPAFTAPAGKATPRLPTPQLEAPAADLTAAVVGLNPIDSPLPVIPEGSRPAQFSAAPEISKKGGDGGSVESATIAMADLMIRGGSKKESIATLARIAPTSKENLLAAGRPVIVPDAPAQPSKPSISISGAVRVTSAPDPRFEGRNVFTVALQMPNVTSYSGSWILWYAERKPLPGEAPDIVAPSALRKVDPVYDLSAVDDRVEGKVQLGAVIHTDGYVYGITVLRGVDPRLDNSAVAALRKWEFEPARRDGVPVDVDVVIEIPFRLRPLVKK